MNKRHQLIPSLADAALERRLTLSTMVAGHVPANARIVELDTRGGLGIVDTKDVVRRASKIESTINLMTGQFSGSTNARIDRPGRAILQLSGTGTIGDGRTTYSLSLSGSVAASITNGGRLGDVIDGRVTLSDARGSISIDIQRYRYEIVHSTDAFSGTRGRGGLSLYVNLNNFQGPFTLNLKGEIRN